METTSVASDRKVPGSHIVDELQKQVARQATTKNHGDGPSYNDKSTGTHSKAVP